MSEIPGAGFLGSVRQLLATLLETLQVRLELLGTELEQEKRRVFAALMLAAMALVCLALALVMFSVLILLIFWDGYRIAAACALALLFAVGGSYLLVRAKQKLSAPSGLFESSLAELQRDRAKD
jgi:uncharacterized membrane protein YqjE